MRKKITISDYILLILEKTVDGYCRLEDFTYHHYRYRYGIAELRRSSLSKALRKLRIDGYLDLEEYNNELVLKLTEPGKIEAAFRKVLRDETWDGKWRIVIFDIPEKHLRVRNALRSKLKSWQFEKWQKSVWASKKNLTKPLSDLITKLGIGKWVKILEADNII